MSVTPLQEQLAIAVLRGDEAAAMALMDQLTESRTSGDVLLSPAKSIKVSRDRLRIIAYVKDNCAPPDEETRRDFTRQVERWLGGANDPILLVGIDRVELYEMPMPVPPFINAVGDAGEEDDPPVADHPTHHVDDECRRIWDLPRDDRTRGEVLYVRRHGGVLGGCCDRYADRMWCNCLDVARS